MVSATTRRVARVAAPGALAGLGVHVVPYLASRAPIRRQLFPVLAGRGDPGSVALTFDDGPDPASTPEFLRALDRLGWTATFFVLGDMVRAAPSLTREIVAAGHEVAVHADQHRAHLWRRPDAVINDVRRAVDVIGDVTGVAPKWFRPPHGSMAGATMAAARRSALTTVLWTTWGRDWTASATPDSVARNLRRHLHGGATMLLHDSSCTAVAGSWRSALGALDVIADDVAAAGWRVVSLEHHGLNVAHRP
jgi:peptidoglycan-N-acetylglucosamine deacetylase